jgi:hypothetical protein
MRTIKAMLLALVLAGVSLTSEPDQSFAGVPTAAAVAPAATASAQGTSTEQVRWRGGGRGWGGRGRGWGGRGWGGRGWRGRGWGGGGWGGGWCYHHPWRCHRRY